MIGDVLRDYRRKHSLSLRQVASKLRMHYSTLSRIEAGERLPRRFVPNIARLIGWDPSELSFLVLHTRTTNELSKASKFSTTACRDKAGRLGSAGSHERTM